MPSLDDPRARGAYEEEPEELSRMSFGDHLDELRKRLIRSILAIVACVFAMLFMKEQVQRVIIEPYRILWRQHFERYLDKFEAKDAQGLVVMPFEREMLEFCRRYEAQILDGTFPEDRVNVLPVMTGFKLPYELVSIGGVEDFWMFMMAALVFAFVVASPVVIWQGWAFIAAGLYQRERKVFLRFFPFAMLLLVGGILFGYGLVLPYGLGWLIRLMVDGLVSSMLTVGNYFTFLFAVTAAMGLIFQLPMVMLALQRVGLVRHRTFVKKWRIIVMMIFVVAALFSPPDPVSMGFMAAPTMVLYGFGLLLTWRGQRYEEPVDSPASTGGAAS